MMIGEFRSRSEIIGMVPIGIGMVPRGTERDRNGSGSIEIVSRTSESVPVNLGIVPGKD